MNQEIKLKLEQAAETAWEQDQQTNPSPVNPHAYVYGYKDGAQTILENPGEWGLWKQYDVVKHANEVAHEAAKVSRELAERQMQSQLTKYREALERVLQSLQSRRPYTPGLGAPINIIRSVLEQEVNND